MPGEKEALKTKALSEEKEKENLSPLRALKIYMEKGVWGRQLGLSEMKALTGGERTELGNLSKLALLKGVK